MATKYIKTKEKKIIIFSDLNAYSDFKIFNPVSAGFIHILTDIDDKVICQCYGESFSLQLKSQKEDSALVQKQIIDSIF